MDPIQVPEMPEDIGALSNEELSALADQFQSAGASLAAAEQTAETVEALTGAANAYQACVDELASREQVAQEAAAAQAAALATLGLNADGSTIVTETVDAPVEQVTASEVEVVTELASAGEALEALAVQQGARTAVLAPVQVKAAGRPRRVRQYTDLNRFADQGVADAGRAGMDMTRDELAATIADRHDWYRGKNIMNLSAPLTIARAVSGETPLLSKSDAMGNFRVMQQLSREFSAMVAAGGNCAIPTTLYEVFNVAEEQSPVDGFLPGIPAPRGGVRYLEGPSWPAAQPGITVTTEAQSVANEVDKACVVFACPEELTCTVDAITACAQFDNLNYMAATELVAVLLDQLAVAAAQRKEIEFLDTIESGSTSVDGLDPFPYGATRNLVNQMGAAAWGYRKRNHMGRLAPLDVLVPDTVIPILKADIIADHALGMNYLDVDQETLADDLFRNMGLNVEFYYDYSTEWGSGNAMQGAQAAGALVDFPIQFRAYLFAPGTWVRLDGGQLNLGIVRDSTLNNTNDLQIWSEEWVQACMLGNESVELDLILCPSGEGPEPATALVCTS